MSNTLRGKYDRLAARERRLKMLELHQGGKTYQQIGDIYHLTRQRVEQIICSRRATRRGYMRDCPPELPCGCPAIMSGSAGGRILRLEDGSRVCRCGKVWKPSWSLVADLMKK